MMKREAFQQAVDAFRHRQPFQPFVIELDTGERVLVDQPEALHCYAGSALYNPSGSKMTLIDNEDVKQVIDMTPAASS